MALLLKYIGKKIDFKLQKSKLVSKAYDFSKGAVEVATADAKVLLETCSKSFVEVVEEKADEAKAKVVAAKTPAK